MRKLLPGIFVLAVLVAVLSIGERFPERLEPVMYDYMVNNFEQDTASRNAVASILLNYRMYDTMFEALILLTAIIGMNQFLPGSGEEPNGDTPSDTGVPEEVFRAGSDSNSIEGDLG